MDTNVNNDLEEPFNTTAAVWLIDPVRQSITEIDTPHLESLVSATVGDDADCFRLDTKYNVAWMSDTDSNPRYAYYFEGMDYPFNVRRYSKSVVVSLDKSWSADTISDYLRFYDKQNVWG